VSKTILLVYTLYLRIRF